MVKKLQLIFTNFTKYSLVASVVLAIAILLFLLFSHYFDVSVTSEDNYEAVQYSEVYSERLDVRELEVDDFGSLERSDSKLKLYKEGRAQIITYDNNELSEVALSANQRYLAFIYYLADTSDVINVIDRYKNGGEINEWVFEAGNYSVGSLAWLGNDYLHAKIPCGTGCTKLILMNVGNGEIKNGIVFHGFDTNNEGVLMPQAFTDWFGVEHHSDYMIGSIRVESKVSESYLVLEMLDEKSNSVGEEWWLFTGDSLVKNK